MIWDNENKGDNDMDDMMWDTWDNENKGDNDMDDMMWDTWDNENKGDNDMDDMMWDKNNQASCNGWSSCWINKNRWWIMWNQNKQLMWNTWNMWIWGNMMWWWETFPTSTEWLPEAKKSEIVKLKDGDTYEMTAYAVKQEVWNRVIRRLSYNGMIPWPIIQVEKWAHIKIKLTNKLWVDTTLHSHWLRLDDSKFDGLPTTMWGQQKPIKPWESFTYELNFPDAWVYWYHPHIREDYTQRMWLYGNYHVTEKWYWSKVDKEEFMILDDISEDDVFYKNRVDHSLMWRFGNIMLINNDPKYKLNLETGKKVRLFITDVANTRTFDFKIIDKAGNIQKLKLVWWDLWRIQKEKIINSQIIAPAQRYIVETVFNKPWTYTIKSKDRKLWEIIVNWKETSVKLWDLRNNSADYKTVLDKFNYYLNKKPDKKLRLTIWMKGQWEMRRWMNHLDWAWNMMWWTKADIDAKERSMWGIPMENDGDKIEWEDNMAMMNRMSNSNMMEWILEDEDTKKENMNINWKFKKGQFVKVEIYNDPNSMHPMQHPIHFHGQRFVVLSRDGVKNTDLQWKDTVLVKNWEKVEILIEMTNPWIWMAHCHIAEHLQSGMMMVFKVEE